MMKKHTLFVIVIIVIALGVGFWQKNNNTVQSLQIGMALSMPMKLPTFILTNTNGEKFTNDNLQQHWSFIFFGYTHCPDICPLTLEALAQVAHHLRRTPQAQFIFITIDPTQDSPEMLKAYLQQDRFKETPFVGLSGNNATIINLTKTIGIHVAKDNINVNNIDHSGTILLTNPEGKLAAIFTTRDKPMLIAQDSKMLMQRYANGV